MKLTFKQLEAVSCMARVLHFQRAADELGISQPALSRIIQTIEATIGKRLFDRHTREVSLTDIGREVTKFADKMLALSARGLDQIEARAKGITGEVSIAMLPSITSSCIADILANFIIDYPNIRLHIHDLPADRIEQLLVDSEIDIGIGTTLSSEDSLVNSTPLTSEAFILILPADHRLSAHKLIAFSDFANEPIVTTARGTSIRRWIEKEFERNNQKFEPVLELNQMVSVAAMVRAGIGLALLPEAYTTSLQGDARIIRRSLQQQQTREICLLRRSGRTLIPAAITLINKILKHAREQPNGLV